MKAKYPFKETPILYGKSAERFDRLMEEVDNMSQEERRKNWEEVCKSMKSLSESMTVIYNIAYENNPINLRL